MYYSLFIIICLISFSINFIFIISIKKSFDLCKYVRFLQSLMLYCHAKNMYYTVDLLCFTHKSCIFSEFFPEIYLPMGPKWTINHKMHFYWHIQEENIKLSLLVAWIVLYNVTLLVWNWRNLNLLVTVFW